MKIEVKVKYDEELKSTVHALFIEGKSVFGPMPLGFTIKDILAVFFRSTEVGVVCEMRVGQAIVGQFLFLSCAGSSGWLKTAERLQKTIADLIAELDTKELENGDHDVPSFDNAPCSPIELTPPGKQIIDPRQAPQRPLQIPGQAPIR